MSLHQRLPGKACRPVRVHLVDRVGRERQRPDHVVELELARLHAQEAELQCANHAAQARIAGQHLNEPLRLRKHFICGPSCSTALEQQAVLRKKRAALQLDRSI